MLLTNACGGVSGRFSPGDLMLVEDHVNLTGQIPLLGASHPVWEKRFPDLNGAYSPKYRALMAAAAERAGVKLSSGILAFMVGPPYETPAEIQALKSLGVDVVGMSTVPEVILARAALIDVVALSCVTNAAGGGGHISHEEVLACTSRVADTIRDLLQNFFRLIGADQ